MVAQCWQHGGKIVAPWWQHDELHFRDSGAVLCLHNGTKMFPGCCHCCNIITQDKVRSDLSLSTS